MRKFRATAWAMASIMMMAFLVSGCAVSVSALVEDLGSENSARAERAVKQLGQRGDEAQPLVLEALEDSSPEVRANAALALYEIEGEACAKSIAPLLNDEDSDVRETAVDILIEAEESGVNEIIAAAETYNSEGFTKSARKVIKALDEDGVAWMLAAYAESRQPGGKRLAVSILSDIGDDGYEYLLEAAMDKDIGYPQKLAAAELFGESGADGYAVLSAACDEAEESSEKQSIEELMLLLYGYETDSAALVDMSSRFALINGFEDMLLGAYMNEGCSEAVGNSVCKIVQGSNLWLVKRFITYYATQPSDGKAALIELLSKVGASAVPALVNSEEDPALRLEMLQKMDKQAVVEGLTGLLTSADSFTTTAQFIVNLGYPEFADGISKLTVEYADTLDMANLTALVKPYAADPAVDAFIKSLCEYSQSFKGYMAANFSVDDYAGITDIKKKGDGDGVQDSIVILEYMYEENYDVDSGEDKAEYVLSISPLSFKLVPMEQQLSLADTQPADTAVFIKTKLTKRCTYYFSSLGKYVKGYRTDYVISVVDLKTEKVLGSKTLKGKKAPGTIYDNEVFWSVKRYMTEPPDDEDVEAAITELLGKYTG